MKIAIITIIAACMTGAVLWSFALARAAAKPLPNPHGARLRKLLRANCTLK